MCSSYLCRNRCKGWQLYLLVALVPGTLLVEALVGQSDTPPTSWERALYSVATGFAIAILGMLGLSYLPGGLETWQTFVFFDVLIIVLTSIIIWQDRSSQCLRPDPAIFEDAGLQVGKQHWLLAGILVLLLTGAFFRFANLGYSEYQGDEARAAERAAAIIQGYDDVLMLHKKGPTEIVLPAAVYSLTGRLTETTSRLPFAVANLTALFAVFLLGWRLFNPLTGWIAAMFFALDGYFIGFSRIVQYQSVVFLTSILVVLILYRLVQQPRNFTRYLTLASLLLAAGLLSHYEAALVVIPAAFLLAVLFWQNRSMWREILIGTVLGGAVGVAMLAFFYVPFVLHPHFQATYTYLTDRRIGGSFPYNNLSDFLLRTTVYSTTYYVGLLTVFTVVALVRAYRRGLGRIWGIILGALVLALIAVTLWNPNWMTVGQTDLIVLPFALLLGLAVFMPKMSVAERTLWLWFGLTMLLAIFFTEKPRTHVYTFFLPWLLLAAWGVSVSWDGLRGKMGRGAAVLVGASAALLLTLLFGSYAYWYFIHNTPEILRTWESSHPGGYWVPYDEPDNRALFGFPLSNGWKVVGQLYAEGVIEGDYETNEKEAWVPAWYTRGAYRCGRTADWYFEIDNLEPWNTGDQRMMEHFLRGGFTKWGVVEVNDAEQLVIYQRTGEELHLPNEAPTDDLPHFKLAEYEAAFDANATPDFPLTYPIVEQPIGNPLHVNFGDLIWLEGYDIDYPQPLRQGDTIELTLYWRAQQPIFDSYKVFNQSFFGDGVIVAQKDGYPVCDSRETWRWDPGELITDVYEIPVKDDAPDGLYPLYTGLYIEETFDRLHILDENGQDGGSQWHVTDIRVGEE